MSKLSALRLEQIKKVMREWGLQEEETFTMSIWEVARMLNNTWQAVHFCNPAKVRNQYAGTKFDFAIHDHEIFKLFRAIRSALRSSDEIGILCGDNRAEYLIWNCKP
jgi:hypothetical protein